MIAPTDRPPTVVTVANGSRPSGVDPSSVHVPAERPRAPGASAHVSRIELALLLGLLLVGFAVRAWDLPSAGLNHFDEGVYVFSALGLSDPGQPLRLYPEQVKFSPPLFLGLVVLAYHLFGGPSDTAAILVNVLFGTFTIALIWGVGRAWFGPAVGIGAAALLALSNFHILMSRTVLTDVVFTFFFVLALWAISAAFERGTFGSAAVAGLAVGLAWNAKYHGWLALVIAAGFIALVVLRERRFSRALIRPIAQWGIIAAVAAACYLPWALFVQFRGGGYAELLRYYQDFLSNDWLMALRIQAESQLFLEGPLSRASVLIALGCVLLVSSVRAQPMFGYALVVLALSAASLILGASGTAILLTLAALPMLLRKPALSPAWIVLIWLGLLLLTTPLYRPYARLALPFTIATYLVAAVSMAALLNGLQLAERVPDAARRLAVAATAALIVGVIAALLPNQTIPWAPASAMADAASGMERFIPSGESVVVLGEPAIAFYLHLANRPTFQQLNEFPAQWASRATPVYLVGGVYAQRAPWLREELRGLDQRLTPLATFHVTPNEVRLLDDFSPADASRYRAHPDDTYNLTLYYLELKPGAP